MSGYLSLDAALDTSIGFDFDLPWSQSSRHLCQVGILVVDAFRPKGKCQVTGHAHDPHACFPAIVKLGSLSEDGHQGERKGMVC